MTAAVPEHQTPPPVPSADALLITRLDDGTIRVENAPLPERIEVAAELWDQILTEAPPAGDAPEPGDERWAWIEIIDHAGHVDGGGEFMPVDNDGYVLHIDATNVTCTYRFNYAPKEGQTATGVLMSWGEK
jgi:hypothetical protein